MAALASSVPLAVLAAASQVTSTIRLGLGGVTLPNHSALSVAEGFRLLGTLAWAGWIWAWTGHRRPHGAGTAGRGGHDEGTLQAPAE